MNHYYYELTNGHGMFSANSDEEALEHIEKYKEKMVLYRENDKSPDGKPFIIVKEWMTRESD